MALERERESIWESGSVGVKLNPSTHLRMPIEWTVTVLAGLGPFVAPVIPCRVQALAGLPGDSMLGPHAAANLHGAVPARRVSLGERRGC